MHRYFLHLAYNGSPFHGWQRQKNAHSVQAEIEESMSKLFQKNISTMGCGRTDTGVHARSFYLHFDLEEEIENKSNTVYRLNQMLPKSISIFECHKVHDEAHARFDASSRTYRYYIIHEKDPFNQDFNAFFPGNFNLEAMNNAADKLLDYKDFTSFSKVHTETFTNECDIIFARWSEQENGIVFEIKANRFLRNMVRAIVGTCLEVGKEKMSIEDFKAVINAKDRQKAGHSVPAKGLFLEQVEYPFIKKKKTKL
ncbi:MAG: tRNA pseudouridine(38-40) synthase TruA [Bacteroidota bacterium]